MNQLNSDLYLGDPYLEDVPDDLVTDEDSRMDWYDEIAQLREWEGADQ